MSGLAAGENQPATGGTRHGTAARNGSPRPGDSPAASPHNTEGDTMTDPIQVLRDATAFRTVASLNAYPEALAQVEKLVRAAQWTVGTATLPQKGGRTVHVLRDSTDALAAALAPFKENP